MGCSWEDEKRRCEATVEMGVVRDADYREVLRRLVVNDERYLAELIAGSRRPGEIWGLDAELRSLARIGALTAQNGPAQAFRWEIGDALDAGVSPEQIVGLLVALAPLVGTSRVAEVAPKVALALDYDLEAALE